MGKKILVTGGCGYIGGHTIVDLIQNGFEVISADNMSRGSAKMLAGIEKIVGKPIKNYKVDLCNIDDTEAIFLENPDIAGVIHFAAYKSVPESVADPLMYFKNNFNSLINLLQCAEEFDVTNFVFSSSCSVYGNTNQLPVVEEVPFAPAESPYARTKQVGEAICEDFTNVNKHFNTILLRYFNPAGAHPSGFIGEFMEKPENVVPVITQTAIGKRESMTVFGTDYDTKDGSCVRDYIHVCDIANAHTRALQYIMDDRNKSNCEIFNLGTGNGVSVLELITAFEKVSGLKLNYNVGPRRDGDVVEVYANNNKARKLLGWETKYDLDAMMDTSWKWEKILAEAAKEKAV
ncbi:UDP-glucose 4-epimerase GalE [Flavipsychrobacter stenotrophus]|uniref:UDP-glucose 4-epimerase n=1 Tax=Flavipsychrobacter stenotrophus TaxID=2077091 RepID=A0A2S7SVE2_9BACT|nr:UDP-glucose 4-epimerase GalE [Flavipsychrobacter stenotrophus]PQJ10890.1 UDP-glucose 4-epimerase GalE [Flavipsychrobacter stenotrophus]